MSEPPDPASEIRDEIRRGGPIGFDRFMRLALYGRGGFFQRETSPVGRGGDFVTSPHVHPFVFARCVRAALLETWSALGEPDPLRVVELGAGDGTFADALAEAFAELPAPALAYTGVEIGDGARGALAARGHDVGRTLDDVEPFDGVVFANELLDNLPFRLAKRDGDALLEIRVGLDERDELVRVASPWPSDVGAPDVAAVRDGEEVAVPVELGSFLDALAARLHRGFAILVDYGARGHPGEIRGYVEQRVIGDVLAVPPGRSDITAGVDVELVARLAAERGLVAAEPVRQRAALEALGFARWDTAMRERQAELQATGAGSDAVRVWASRSRATILVDPERLGALWWIVLSTPDAGEPAWLERARAAR